MRYNVNSEVMKMIKKFSVANFRSFDEKQVIDFKPNREDNLADTNISSSGVLKSLGFFGENGGGKTNTIEALYAVISELIGNNDVTYSSHSFIFNKKKRINFSIDFEFDSDTLSLSYSVISDYSTKQIVDEELVINSKKFNRKTDALDKKIPESKLMTKHLFINDLIEDPYKSVLNKMFNYLKKTVYYHCDKKTVTKFDDTFEFENGDTVLLNEKSYLKDDSAYKRINVFLSENYMFELDTIELENKSKSKFKDDYRFLFVDYGKGKFIPAKNESSGNKDLIMFAQFFDYVIQNEGLIIVDELNSSFHTELSSMLIRYFNNKSTKSQFIFASQDTNLMNSELLRADQIYFINRNKNMASEIDRLSNYNVRSTQNYQKLYRSSVVSRLPFFKRVYKDE